jgi:hypothetical protein
MDRFETPTETVKYPFQICGIFKTPARTMSDNVAYSNDQD